MGALFLFRLAGVYGVFLSVYQSIDYGAIKFRRAKSGDTAVYKQFLRLLIPWSMEERLEIFVRIYRQFRFK